VAGQGSRASLGWQVGSHRGYLMVATTEARTANARDPHPPRDKLSIYDVQVRPKAELARTQWATVVKTSVCDAYVHCSFAQNKFESFREDFDSLEHVVCEWGSVFVSQAKDASTQARTPAE
jgi:hypothetical protein